MTGLLTANAARRKARELREIALQQANPTVRKELKLVADEYDKLARELANLRTPKDD